MLKHATRAEVESTVKLWLRYAYDRTGGRDERRKNSVQTRRAASDVESD